MRATLSCPLQPEKRTEVVNLLNHELANRKPVDAKYFSGTGLNKNVPAVAAVKHFPAECVHQLFKFFPHLPSLHLRGRAAAKFIMLTAFLQNNRTTIRKFCQGMFSGFSAEFPPRQKRVNFRSNSFLKRPKPANLKRPGLLV